MLRVQVISQQNTQTENQNVVTMCHIKKYLKTQQKLKISKISDIFERKYRIYIRYILMIYIGDIYRANPVCSMLTLLPIAQCVCFVRRVQWHIQGLNLEVA